MGDGGRRRATTAVAALLLLANCTGTGNDDGDDRGATTATAPPSATAPGSPTPARTPSANVTPTLAVPDTPPSSPPSETAAAPTARTSTADTTTTPDSTGAAGTSPLEGDGPGPLGAEIMLPDDAAGATTIVLVHGGAWVAGAPSSMAPLARELADLGHVVVNVSYSTLVLGGEYPGIVDDVACGVRFGRAVADDVGATGPIVVVGHSAGAHLAVVASFSPDQYGGDCAWPGTSRPDAVVSLAGVFAIDTVGPVMRALIGATREQRPDLWDAFDPYALLGEPTAGVGAFPVTMLVGEDDQFAPPRETRRFHEALLDAGVEAEAHFFPDLDHFTIIRGDFADAIDRIGLSALS